MIYHMFAVKDLAIGAFNTPMYFRSRGEAIRSFMDACITEKAFISHPEDYEFHCCGEFEDGTGIFSSRPPELVLRGVDAVKKEKGGI